MSISVIPKTLRRRIVLRDGGRCRYCQLSQFGQAAAFHINHIKPRSRGGATEEANLALQCPYCSLHKADLIEGIDPSTGEIVPLFHPLERDWKEHFVLRRDGTCRGVTAVGRATVAILKMNDSLPRVARLLQLHLGLLQPSE